MKVMKKIALSLINLNMFSTFGCSKAIGQDNNSPGNRPLPTAIVDFTLEMPESGDFTILQLSDIQIIDSSQQRTPDRLSSGEVVMWAPQTLESNCFSIMRKLVKSVKPNLIVLAGDNVYGEFDDSGSSLAKLIAELDSYDTPWALVFGNHDNETAKGLSYTNAQYANSKNCIFKKGTVTGNSNYTVGVTKNNELKEIIFLVDSNGCANTSEEGVARNAGYYDDQLEWYNAVCAKAKDYNKGENLPSIGFSHIPIRAFGVALYNNTKYQSNVNGFFRNLGGEQLPSTFQPIKILPNQADGFGYIREDFGMLDASGAFYNSMVKNGTKGWYFGHEHQNNGSIVTDEGVRLTFGLKTGFYDSYSRDLLGGTKIIFGKSGYKTQHVQCLGP